MLDGERGDVGWLAQTYLRLVVEALPGDGEIFGLFVGERHDDLSFPPFLEISRWVACVREEMLLLLWCLLFGFV